MPAETSSPSNTRRGLVLVLYAQAATALLALISYAAGSGFLFVLVLSMVGLVSAGAFYFLWQGRTEPWGPPDRLLRWASGLFVATALLFSLILVAFTTTVPQTNRVADLRAPVYLVPVFVLVEALTVATLLWPWAERGDRLVLRILVAGALVAGPLLAWEALGLIDDLILRFGPTLNPQGDAAADVLEVFHEEVRGSWTLYALASRAFAGFATWRVIGHVAAAEPATPRAP